MTLEQIDMVKRDGARAIPTDFAMAYTAADIVRASQGRHALPP